MNSSTKKSYSGSVYVIYNNLIRGYRNLDVLFSWSISKIILNRLLACVILLRHQFFLLYSWMKQHRIMEILILLDNTGYCSSRRRRRRIIQIIELIIMSSSREYRSRTSNIKLCSLALMVGESIYTKLTTYRNDVRLNQSVLFFFLTNNRILLNIKHWNTVGTNSQTDNYNLIVKQKTS